MSLYTWLSGPLLRLSLLLFAGGMLYRVVWYVRGLDWQRDRVAYRAWPGRGVRGALSSIVIWLLPFGPRATRRAWVAVVGCWLFHTGLILVALFVSGHEDMRRLAFGHAVSFGLPAVLADSLTVMSLVGLVVLALRRCLDPTARWLTRSGDWLVLGWCGLVLCTGLMARLHSGQSGWLEMHMLTAEVLLVAAPFTRLNHMVLFFLSRAQLGADYAIKRGGSVRGAVFPW